VSPPNDSFQGVSPIILSSACDVLANNSAIPDSGLLSYPFRKAIVIEEIRWTLRLEDTVRRSLGALVYSKLMLGQHYLMRDAVPIWLLGTLMTRQEEEDGDLVMANPRQAYSHYRWRLPEPLYIDAGQVLSSQFSRGNDGFGSINATVAYVGRTVAPNTPRPRIIPVPYAAPFVTTLGQTYQQSNEAHLFNPFDRMLRVQRLTGRVLSFVSGTTCLMVKNLTPATAGGDTTVLMNDSWGGKMVNNNTGISDVFDCLRAAWTVDTQMPPKGIYEARIWNLDAAQQVHIAVIGTREERS
jgi:hypothetical protein